MGKHLGPGTRKREEIVVNSHDTGYGTPFVETEALCAAMAGDDEAVRRTVSGLTPAERHDLYRAVLALDQVLYELDES